MITGFVSLFGIYDLFGMPMIAFLNAVAAFYSGMGLQIICK